MTIPRKQRTKSPFSSTWPVGILPTFLNHHSSHTISTRWWDNVRPRRTPVLLNKLIAKVFGTSNERAIKRLMPIVLQINDFEPAIHALSDEALRANTAEFRH